MLYLKLQTNSALRTANSSSFEFSKLESLKNHEPVRQSSDQLRSQPSVLDGLYKLYVDESTDILSLCDELESEYDNVLYAEPVYQEELFYVPSDPDASDGNQDYLSVIEAFDAWDVTQGDSTLIIGIIDTGVERDHDEITSKIALNENDPPNGVDDDENGYVDDYWGYDFADGDSIPEADYSFHGNRVAGLAGAATDNGIGIAGVGFNSRIRPLKIFKSSDNTANGAYEAIVYAADNGYDVINLSWGSVDSYSQAAADIINYAVLEKNVVVVAAAGNTPSQLDFYPASYENVLSVAATTNSDTKASFSTYSYKVDVCAPGNAIYSTFENNGYGSDSGTSYSSPMTAGAVALVKSVFPKLDARQIRERIRVTSDDIYASNSGYQDMLGYGRLNVYQAVTATDLKAVRLQNIRFYNGTDSAAYRGDTIQLFFGVKNFLDATDELSLTFSSVSPYITFLTDSVYLGTMKTGAEQSIALTSFALASNTPADTYLAIRVGISDGTYSDYQYIELTTGENAYLLNNGMIQLTVAEQGLLGESVNVPAIGLTWNNSPVAAELGFSLAYNAGQVSDNLPDTAQANDFTDVYPVTRESHPMVDYLITSTYRDNNGTKPIGLVVDQQVLTNSSADYLIQEYRISNASGAPVEQLKAGFYCNWALTNQTMDRAYYVDSLHTVIATNNSQTLFSGVRTFYDTSPVAQAIDLAAYSGNAMDFYNLMNDSLVYTLQSQAYYDSAGWNGTGNNVATFLSQDSISLASTRSQKVAFLTGFATSAEALLQVLDSAEAVYTRYLGLPPLLEEVWGCTGAALTIVPGEGTNYRFYSDPLGQHLIAENDTLFTDPLYGDTTFYAVNTDSSYESAIYRIQVNMESQVANFTMDPDTLLLSAGVNKVAFTDASFLPLTWNWNLGNGTRSVVQNPVTTYDSAGFYTISLAVFNDLGCYDTLSRTLMVANRPDMPDLEDQAICSGNTVTFGTTPADTLALYLTADSPDPVQTGTSIAVPDITSDTTFYVTRIVSGLESFKKALHIEVHTLSAAFTCVPDTSSAAFNAAFRITSTGSFEEVYWYINQVLTAQTESFILEPVEESYTVALVLQNSMGCADSVSRRFRFSKTPEPVIDSAITVCLGADLTLAPQNGIYFGFYKDQDLTTPISKTSFLQLTTITDSMEIFVVGLDSILPSDPVSVSISPEKPVVSIVADPDTLYLTDQQTALFTAEGSALTSWKWYLDGIFTETIQSPRLYFDAEATYHLTLKATDGDGCSASDTLDYLVYTAHPIVLGTGSTLTPPYPNPTDGTVTVPLSERTEVTLYDPSGLMIRSWDVTRDVIIDLTGMPSGLYIIQCVTKSDSHYWKILLR